LQPQSVVYWTAVHGAGSDSKGYRGRSTVNSEGNINLGPYGDVHVAGLSMEQAKSAVTRQVSRHAREPQVSLSLHPPTLDSTAIASTGGPTGANAVVRTSHTAGGGPSLTDGATPAESRLVPAPNPGPSLSPRAEAPVIVEPNSTPELPFPRTMNSEQIIGHVGPGGRAPNEMNMIPLPPYIIGVTDILLIEYKPVEKVEKLLGDQPVAGQHLVNPDGTVHIGTYGQVRVAGLTLEAARQAVADLLRLDKVDIKRLNVDILAYNSKKYYVITDGAGAGEQVYTFPVTGNDTVLDAIGHIGGLPPVASKRHIWVARRNVNGGYDNILPVDWIGTTQRAIASTNYQIMPGDRVYVYSDKWKRADENVRKVLSPFERILGATLLGASTVQEIRMNPNTSSGITGR
jgi:polysaccharide export outer membrane protein